MTTPDKNRLHQVELSEEELDEEASQEKGCLPKRELDEEARQEKGHLHESELDEEAQQMAEECIGWLRRNARFHQQGDYEVCDDRGGLIQHTKAFYANYAPQIKACHFCAYVHILIVQH
jgi:hypothetical protein